MGFDFAVGPYAEHSRVVHRLSSGLGTWSIRSGTAQNLSGMELIVCSQPLTFDWDSIHRQTSDVRSVTLLFRHATSQKKNQRVAADNRKMKRPVLLHEFADSPDPFLPSEVGQAAKVCSSQISVFVCVTA